MRKIIITTLILALLVAASAWAGSQNIKDARETFTLTTSVQAGWSSTTTVFPLFGMYQEGFDALWGRIDVYPSATTLHGLGLADSAFVTLSATTTKGDTLTVVAEQAAEGLPATFYFAMLANDTLWKELVTMDITISDSTGDTALSADYKVEWYFVRTGEKHR